MVGNTYKTATVALPIAESKNALAREMTFLQHLEELRVRVIRIVLAIGVVSVLSFVLSIREVKLGDLLLYLPLPDPFENIASQVIRRVAGDTLPSFVKLVVTAPGQAIVAQFYVSVLLGIIIGMPVISREVGGFLNPALYPHEKRMVLNLLIPATVLFAVGALVSYILMVPFMLDFLYRYAVVSGPVGQVVTFITIDGLMGFVFVFLVAFGLVFQLPIIMWVATKVGLVQPGFWMKYFRYAFVAFVIFGAVITPDGSGITMWFVALPMTALYGLGYLVIRLRLKPKAKLD